MSTECCDSSDTADNQGMSMVRMRLTNNILPINDVEHVVGDLKAEFPAYYQCNFTIPESIEYWSNPNTIHLKRFYRRWIFISHCLAMLKSLFVGENKSEKSLFFCICKQQETRFATNGSDFQQMLNGLTFVPRVIGIFDFLQQYLIWLTFMMYICHIMILMGE